MKDIILTQRESSDMNRIICSNGGVNFLVFSEGDQFCIEFYNTDEDMIAFLKTNVEGETEEDTQMLEDTQFFLRFEDIVESIVTEYVVACIQDLEKSVVDLDILLNMLNDVMQGHADKWLCRVKETLNT